MGYYDEDGYFFMVDRKKEMVNVGGEKVFPREVEEIMYTHPAIAEAALVPQPDAKLGEIPVAVVALKPGASSTEGELVEFLSDKLAQVQGAPARGVSWRACRAIPSARSSRRRLRPHALRRGRPLT